MDKKYLNPPGKKTFSESGLSPDPKRDPKVPGLILIDEALSWITSNNINIPKPSEVRNYLSKYDDMLDLTKFVCKITRENFDDDSQLSLEVFRDPEIENESLTLYVRQKDYEVDIFDKFEELDEEYGGALADKSGYILVTTDFKKPRE